MKSSLYIGLVFLTGCASMFSGRHQDIKVKAVDAETGQMIPDALIMLTEHNGIQHKAQGVGMFEVTRSDGNMTLVGAKHGYKMTRTDDIRSRLNRVMWFNLFGVLPFPGFGFMIDKITRADREYPNEYTVYMQKKS